MTAFEKCTYIHVSSIGAPTLKAEVGASNEPVLDAKWDLHYSEYTTGSTSQPYVNTPSNLYIPNA